MAPSRVRIPPSPLAQRPPRLCAHPRRGGRAVECGGLENRYPSLGGSRVQIPPPPLPSRNARAAPETALSGAAEPVGPLERKRGRTGDMVSPVRASPSAQRPASDGEGGI